MDGDGAVAEGLEEEVPAEAGAGMAIRPKMEVIAVAPSVSRRLWRPDLGERKSFLPTLCASAHGPMRRLEKGRI